MAVRICVRRLEVARIWLLEGLKSLFARHELAIFFRKIIDRRAIFWRIVNNMKFSKNRRQIADHFGVGAEARRSGFSSHRLGFARENFQAAPDKTRNAQQIAAIKREDHTEQRAKQPAENRTHDKMVHITP